MSRTKTIMAVLVAGLTLAPLPASAHGADPGRIMSGLIGGLFGAVSQALCRGNCPPPAYYPPAPYYPPPAYNYAPMPPPSAADPDISFVQHVLNVLDGAGLAEDGVGGPATKQALLGYLNKQLKRQES